MQPWKQKPAALEEVYGPILPLYPLGMVAQKIVEIPKPK